MVLSRFFLIIGGYKVRIIVNDVAYDSGTIKAKKIREALEIDEAIDYAHIEASIVDKSADFVVSLYGNQFTRENLYNGIDGDVFLQTMFENIARVIGDLIDVLNTFPPTNGSEKISVSEWLKQIYLDFLESGWTLREIEETDLILYLKLKSYEANKDQFDQVSALDAAGL